jgi:hypothetical protein
MDNENIEKKMEFIVEHQAHLTVKLEQLEELIKQLGGSVSLLAKATLDRFEDTDKRADGVDEKIAALVDAQIRTDENVKQTSEDLRNLIAVVDRYFSSGLNGNSKA